MMLSASAARMGCVKTTLREIGKSRRGFSAASGGRKFISAAESKKINGFRAGASFVSDVNRWKSTMAISVDSDDEEMFSKSHGYTEAAKVRSAFSHEEAWMANLGRDDNNEWLLGPRDADNWFTGLKPTACPGENDDSGRGRFATLVQLIEYSPLTTILTNHRN